MKALRCPFCAGTLKIDETSDRYICEYCGTPMSLDRVDDDKINSIKERANKLFLSCDFDSAASLYQSILTELPNDAEIYWLLALCTYGIQYVDDPLTGKRIPTCHRTIYTSILNNDYYINALECADILTREAYQEAANRIDQIQKSILDIVAKEDSYDVFICYKETDEYGHRTKESDIAKDLYYKLTSKGYKTFYAPETLQEKAGREYEPYIFAALNTARIMITIGFSTEHFNAVWVKNEWSRFLARKMRTPRLMLICCYNSFLMSASDIPIELSKTQAKDLANASTNDLVADIQKLMPKKTTTVENSSSSVNINNLMSSNAGALLKRGFIYLEDKEFREATESFNKSLDMNPELSKAYWGLLLAKSRCRNNDDLATLGVPIIGTNEYRKASRFASSTEQEEYQDVINAIDSKISNTTCSLYAKRRSQINELSVNSVLSSAEVLIDDAQQNYDSSVPNMVILENNIKECLAACSKEIAPFQAQITQQKNAIQTLVNTYSNHTRISDEDKNTLIENVNTCKKLANEARTKANETIANSVNFKKLNDLKQQYSNVIKNFEELKDKLKGKDEELRTKYNEMERIENLFKPALSEVLLGKYDRAKQLLS